MEDKNLHQTYLKDCNCTNGGIIIWEGKAVCRWCRVPYAKGGCMSYLPEHFQSPHSGSVEWEIVAYHRKEKPSVITTLRGNGLWLNKGTDGDGYYPDPSKDPDWIIHSVLRKSDNTVWSVGDMTTMGGINKFEISEGDLYWWNETIWHYLSDLSKLPPERTKLFTDFNGNNIYSGDTIYYVLPDFKIHSNPVNDFDGSNPNYKYFSTHEKAEEYVVENKILFSVKDIWAISAKYGLCMTEFENEVKQLAQSKINI